jgi:hypothetical protein
MPSVQASAVRRPLLISSLLLFGACQGTEVVNRGAYEPNIPAPGVEEFERSSKLLFKRCIVAFGEDRWDGVVGDSKRLQQIARKWAEQKPTDAKRSAEHVQTTKRLETASRNLEQAALKADAAGVSRSLGEVAETLTKLHFTDVHPSSTSPPEAKPASTTPPAKKE